jgi:N-acetylglucosaminyl-diphospho-decaprenol L-rhamnosyltransferase
MTPIAVAIVNHNTCQRLRACLASIKLEAASEVVVVDNASLDGSVEMVQADYPYVLLHANKINVGYGAAANQAIASCTARYVLLLNADTVLQPGALRALSTYLDLHPGAAVLGPRLAESDGTLQASCYPFPTPLDTFLENSTCAILLGRLIRRYVPALRRLYLRTWPHHCARVVPWLKGAALAIRREAFDAVNGFDESFFLYFEDADFCYRLKAAGWEIHFAPVTTVIHAGGASTMQYRTEMAVQLLSSTVQFYQRHYSGIRVAQLLMVVKSLMLARWIGGTFRFCFTWDVTTRSKIADDVAASKRILLEHWPEQASLLARPSASAPLTTSNGESKPIDTWVQVRDKSQ